MSAKALGKIRAGMQDITDLSPLCMTHLLSQPQSGTASVLERSIPLRSRPFLGDSPGW